MVRRVSEGERGQILPLVALGIVAILGMLALAIDVGFWRYQERLEQSAADSAAMAGAIRLNYPTTASPQTPSQAAQAAATQNGFQNGGNIVVTVTSPYSGTPPYAGATPYPANTAVQVVVTQTTEKQFFSGIFGSSFGSNSARAVAVGHVADTSQCLTQMSLSSSGGIGITGNKTLKTPGCGVLANGKISVPGFTGTTSLGYWTPDNPDISSNDSGVPAGAVAPLAAPAADPCPLISGCAYLASQPIPTLNKATATDASKVSSLTAPPGGYREVYNCCSGSPTKLGPGLYYVYGGISGTLQGDGVTVVNVDGGMTASGLGSGHPFFSAPTSGNTVGVAFYQPPSNSSQITLNGGGNGTSEWDGLFYAPTASGTSNGGSATFAELVIGTILLHGGGNGQGLTIDPTLGGTTSIQTSAFPTHVVLSE